jgi:hypothetical protein
MRPTKRLTRTTWHQVLVILLLTSSFEFFSSCLFVQGEWSVLPGGDLTEGIPRSMTAHKATNTLFVYFEDAFIAKYNNTDLKEIIKP